MNTVPDARETGALPRGRASVQTYARLAGILTLVSLVAGGFGEGYAPSRLIVSTDAAATADNVRALDSLLRWGFAGYLVEAICDITLSLIFYVLLRPVRRNLALLAAFFGLVSTAVYGFSEVFYFSASGILGGADYLKTFSPDQLNTLGLMWLRMFGYGGTIFLAFYGLATVIRGYLIFQSGFLPRFLGVLLIIGGLGFIVRNFAFVLAPSIPSGRLLLLMVPAGVALMLWLIIRGVDVPKWEARVAARDSRSQP